MFVVIVIICMCRYSPVDVAIVALPKAALHYVAGPCGCIIASVLDVYPSILLCCDYIHVHVYVHVVKQVLTEG